MASYGPWDIATIILIVMALLVCAVLMYFLVICYMRMAATERQLIRWREAQLHATSVRNQAATLRPQSIARRNSAQVTGLPSLIGSNRTVTRAVSNEYLPHPMQQAPARYNVDSSHFLSMVDFPVMRFYTAEELVEFPLDQHRQQLMDLFSELERNRPTQQELERQFENHPYRAFPPPSTRENASRRLSGGNTDRVSTGRQTPSRPASVVGGGETATSDRLAMPPRRPMSLQINSNGSTVEPPVTTPGRLSPCPESSQESSQGLGLLSGTQDGLPPPSYSSIHRTSL